MAKSSTIAESPKAGAACGKPQAKAPADKPAKKDVKPSKPGKKGK
ncbi:hypothetical protein [Methanosarcina sp.]